MKNRGQEYINIPTTNSKIGQFILKLVLQIILIFVLGKTFIVRQHNFTIN